MIKRKALDGPKLDAARGGNLNLLVRPDVWVRTMRGSIFVCVLFYLLVSARSQARLIERRFLSAQEQCRAVNWTRRRCYYFYFYARVPRRGAERAGEEQCHLSSANQMQTAGCCRARGLINPCVYVHAETDGYVCMRAAQIYIMYIIVSARIIYVLLFASSSLQHISARSIMHWRSCRLRRARSRGWFITQ
jgi:hypothetical protein